MNSENWSKIKEIFHSALEVAESERARFIEIRCGGDEAIRSEVWSLLVAHAESPDYIESRPIASVTDLIAGSPRPSRIGQVIGAYRIEREIGKGGMGAVYLASRADAEYRKEVAVKLIKRGFDTDEIIRRFRYERQILATLEHPFITRLIDGGATDDGLPYLVMDHVRGVPLTVFANRRRLSIEERLELFVKICSAVAYAHKNLVIHRDLKPSNILVSDDGTPRLLDFGIAKLVASGDGTHNPHPTNTAQRAMTPEYASPEQVAGSGVTTSTDIYSLGVVLYELLTGYRPFELNTKRADEITRIITNTSPSKPSSVCRAQGVRVMVRNPQAAVLELQGDLDNIVLMAIRKEPERRYSSVEQFADDIRRYLAGRPVIAREDTFSYRAAKFIKRNKAGVTAGAGVAASLVGGLIAASRQARNAARERDRARRETRKAEKINEFLKQMLAAADPRVGGRDVKIVDVLSVAAERIDSDFRNQPDIAADLETTLGLTYLGLGQIESAEKYLRSAHEKFGRAFARNSIQFARSLNNLGKLLETKGDLISAEPLYRKALSILRRAQADGSEVAHVLGNLGYLTAINGEPERALELHNEELRIRLEHNGETSAEVVKTLERIGDVLVMMDRINEAESIFRRCLRIVEDIYGSRHPDVARSMINLAGAVIESTPAEAESLCFSSLEMRRELLGEDHVDVVWSLYNLAYVLINRDKFDEAGRYLVEALAKRGANLASEHPVVSSCLLLLGRVEMHRGDQRSARAAFEECLELRQKTLPPDHWLIASTISFLGECVFRMGETERGRAMMLESYAAMVARQGRAHTQTRQASQRLARLGLIGRRH